MKSSNILFLFLLSLIISLSAFSQQPIITPTSPLIERWNPVSIIEVEHKGELTQEQGLLFFRLSRKYLCAFDANTGEEKFREDIGLEKYVITDDNNRAYIGKYKEGLFLYDCRSGRERSSWSLSKKKMNSEPLPGYIDTAPIYDDDLVYVLTSEGLIYAFDSESQNSTPLWRFPTERDLITGSMIVSKVNRHELLIGTRRGQLFRVKTSQTGAKITDQVDLQGAVRFKPIRNPQMRNRVYLIIQGGTLMAIDLLADGKIKTPIWTTLLKARANENLLVTSDNLLCVPIGKEVVAYKDSGRECREIWTSKYRFNSIIKNPLVEYGNEILVATNDVIALSKSDGAKTWSYNGMSNDLLRRSIASLEGAERTLSRFERNKHQAKYFPPIVDDISSQLEVRGNFIYCAMKDKVYAFSPKQLHSIPRFDHHTELVSKTKDRSANTLFYWKYEPTAGIKASPALYDSFLYVGTTTGSIYTVDTNTGLPVGEPVDTGENDAFVGLIVDKKSKTLYAATSNGSLYFYDLSSYIPKQLDHPVRLNSKVSSAPILFDKQNYVGSDRGLYAVDILTKDRKKFDCGAIKASPWILPSSRTVCFGTQDNKIYGVSADYGLQEKWTSPFATEGQIVATAQLSSYTFYVGDEHGNVYAIDTNGKQVWKNSLGNSIQTTPAFDGNSVYATTHSGDIYTLNDRDGSERLVKNIGTAPLCSFVAGKYLIVVAEDGMLYAFENDEQKWVYREVNSKVSAVPLVDNNVIYMISENGKLFALDIALLD